MMNNFVYVCGIILTHVITSKFDQFESEIAFFSKILKLNSFYKLCHNAVE